MCTNEGLPASHGSVLKMFCLFMPFLQPASRIYDSVSKHCVIHRVHRDSGRRHLNDCSYSSIESTSHFIVNTLEEQVFVNVPWQVILPATESKPIAGASALKHTDAVRWSY